LSQLLRLNIQDNFIRDYIIENEEDSQFTRTIVNNIDMGEDFRNTRIDDAKDSQ
jgi:hypothetical protein